MITIETTVQCQTKSVVDMRALCALLLALLLPDGTKSQGSCQKRVSGKIVGGEYAASGAYPWFTSLVPASSLRSRATGGLTVWCGGSLISRNKVLTAGHCYYPLRSRGGKWMSKLTAVYNLKDRCSRNYGKAVPIIKVEIHPQYNPVTVRNDIAIATLSEDVTITPVCLAPKGRGSVSAKAEVIGFGNTVEGGKTEPCRMMEASIQIYTRTECLKTTIARDFRNLPGAICAGTLSGGRDTCQGDSGGPLVKTVNDVVTLQGITSFGNGCGRKNSPGVYTDVSYYRGWIDGKIAGKASSSRPSVTSSLQ